jgi:hypothetical protein
MHLLRKEMAGKSVEELNEFDEDKFFSEDMRGKYPYLYAQEAVPATTAPSGYAGHQQGAPTPAMPEEGNGDRDEGVDAKRMSQDDYKALLRKRGLSDPSVGMPG